MDRTSSSQVSAAAEVAPGSRRGETDGDQAGAQQMDPDLYRAAMEGKVDVLGEKRDQFDIQTTPGQNTVLHVAAQHGNLESVKVILNSCPRLLEKRNAKRETALHVAAKRGHAVIVQFLIQKAEATLTDVEMGIGATRMLIRMADKKRNTALHEAARYNQLDVVKVILAEEDSGFSYVANSAGETPLYIAAERRFFGVAQEILKIFNSPSYDGPSGRTALHAAVKHDHEELAAELLKKKPELVKVADYDGWTPLHYAAFLHYSSRVKQLLVFDQSVAYFKTEDERTALHIAASVGATSSMEEIVSFCPDCAEVPDGKGRNVLHIAAENGRRLAVKYILKNPLFSDLINEGDDEGNTPLHLLAISKKFIPDLIKNREVDKWALNDTNFTPLEMVPNLTSSSKSSEIKIRNALKKQMNLLGKVHNPPEKTEEIKLEDEWASFLERARETHLVVAALIATVTFAAGFTLPGGYNQNAGEDIGLAVLTKKPAFKAFIISDTIALILSISAVLLHFVSALHDEEEIYKILRRTSGLTMLAMGAMTVAFVTGVFVVLGNAIGLGVGVCAISSCFFLLGSYHLRHKLKALAWFVQVKLAIPSCENIYCYYHSFRYGCKK